MYFDESNESQEKIILPWDSRLAITINGLAIIALGLLPSSIITLARAVFIG